MSLYSDLVVVSRGGVQVGTVDCGWDPAQDQLHAPYDADVRPGDVLAFSGLVRRVTVPLERWRMLGWDAGSVIQVEPAPLYLPDLGRLALPAGEPVLNETTGVLTPTPGAEVWVGPCKVEPAATEGSTPELGDQRVGIASVIVTVPLEVTGVQPGQVFTVTQSRDQLLVTRTLTIKAFRTSSSATTRELVAIDNQG